MGIFGRLFSRKKRGEGEEEQLDYGDEGEDESVKTQVPPWSKDYEERYSQRRERPDGFGEQWQQPQQPQQQQFQQQSGSHEIILAKLDVINAKLDSLNQRLANLERYAAEDEKEKSSSRSRW